MPVPAEYDRASKNFYDYLVVARDLAWLQTTNQSYTMTQGVLQAFRRRISLEQAIAFANTLPLLLRALFVTDWDVGEPRRPFEALAAMTLEVQGLRQGHNWSPDDAIACVARALRQFVDQAEFDRVVAACGPGAVAFWAVPEPR